MKQQTPLRMGQLAGAGMTVIGTLIIGLLLGLLAAKYLHWQWAVIVGILVGFTAGIVSMFRQISSQM